MPEEIPFTGDKGYHLSDVAQGNIFLETFVAQLSDEELEALTRGEGAMGSSLGVVGNAGAFGGVLPSLREKGVPPIITADGPAGLRLKKFTALLPCGTGLACTFDDVLVENLFVQVGKEMKKHDPYSPVDQSRISMTLLSRGSADYLFIIFCYKIKIFHIFLSFFIPLFSFWNVYRKKAAKGYLPL